MKQLADLFITFMKIGTFTFGGGYAMIPVIEDTCVEVKKWITHEDMMNITVIAESTPGPVAINCATFVGYKQRGVPGAIFATMGVLLPSLLIICIIALLLDNFLEITVVANAFKGIKLAVGILIFGAGIRMAKKQEKDWFSCCILVGAAAIMMAVMVFSLNFSSIAMMLIAGLLSLSAYTFKKLCGKKGE